MNNSPINSTINSTTVVELADASSLNVISLLICVSISTGNPPFKVKLGKIATAL